MVNDIKPNVRHFRVFGCPSIFKRYEISEGGKRTKNKYVQQGIRGIFVGFPEDSSGWLFYVPSARKIYISLDSVFDENFTSPLSMPDLPFQGALKMRGSFSHIFNTETLTEVTGPPTGENESFPEELITISPQIKPTKDIPNALSCYDEYDNTDYNSRSSYNDSSMISVDDSEKIKA